MHWRETGLGIKHHSLVSPLGSELGICGVEIRKLVGYWGSEGLGRLLVMGVLKVRRIKWGGGNGGRPSALGLLLDGIGVCGELLLKLRNGR